jgi:uncharacterized protein (DUF2147 family)
MKRFACLVVLTALTTPAYAGSYSFVVGGHHIHLEASQPQIAVVPAPVASKPLETRAVAVTPPAPQAAPQITATAAPIVPVEAKVEPKAEAKVEPKVDPKTESLPRVGFEIKPDVRVEPKVEAKTEVKTEVKAETKPDTTASVTKAPAEKPLADKPAVATKPVPSKTTLQSEGDSVEVPIGDWQTEGRKGLVRIEPCGTALCGYMINSSTNAKGETVLINMKSKGNSGKGSSGKANSEWSGSIYSRASGNTYNAVMTLKRPNMLRVEACVVGHYFCSGNDWTRVLPKPDELITTREASAEPRS